jgi:hypothetical protein
LKAEGGFGEKRESQTTSAAFIAFFGMSAFTICINTVAAYSLEKKRMNVLKKVHNLRLLTLALPLDDCSFERHST